MRGKSSSTRDDKINKFLVFEEHFEQELLVFLSKYNLVSQHLLKTNLEKFFFAFDFISLIWGKQIWPNLMPTLTSMPPTFTLPGFFGDLAQDEAVGWGDDKERQTVQRDDAEQVVGQLVVRGGEEVEGDALLEPRVHWMSLYVEYHALGGQGDHWLQLGNSFD